MATNKTYSVAGVSTHKGITKLRFANDFVNRIKILQKNNHTDIELVQLPAALGKDEICSLLQADAKFQNPAAQTAIADHMARNGRKSLPVVRPVVKQPNTAQVPASRSRSAQDLQLEPALF